MRPFEHLPTEVIEIIFAFVHQDFERLPSPFQLTQVCRRWQKIAQAMKSLWRDTRILRVRDKATTSDCDFSPAVRKAYRWSQSECPLESVCNRADADKISQLRTCTMLSHDSLSHFELEVYDWDAGHQGFRRILEDVERSMQTLESVTFIHAHRDQRQKFRRAEESSNSDFAAVGLAFVLRCPNVIDVRLSVGELTQGGINRNHWHFSRRKTQLKSSFRRLQLDSFGGLTSPSWAAVRQCFLQRSSQLRTLALCNVPEVDMRSITKADVPLALELLAFCANTLVELDLSGAANPLIGARTAGVKSFPRLRRLRYVPHHAPRPTRAGEMDDFAMPALEIIEAPVDLIIALASVPSYVILRLDDWSKVSAECATFAKWLLGLRKDQSPHILALLSTFDPSYLRDTTFDPIIEALTPNQFGKVACPNLTELRIINRAGYLFDSMGICHSLDPAPLPRPRKAGYVSNLLQMEQQRRRVSEGLLPSQEEPGLIAPTAPSSREASSKRQKLSTPAKAAPRCQALCRIEIEGSQLTVGD